MPPRWRRECRGLTVLVAIAVAGCAPPRVDSASDEAFEASLAEVRESLTDDRREAFDHAILTIGAESVTLNETASEPGGTVDVAVGLKAALSGKTADEILAAAAGLRAEQNARTRLELQREIATLVAKQQSAFAARQALEKFETLRPRLVRTAGQQAAGRFLLVDVRNGTPHPVSAAYLEAVAQVPGGGASAIRTELHFVAERPLGPGESGSWRLVPDAGAARALAAIRADALVRVTATRLDGAGGEVLLDARIYTEDDASRLVSLQYQLTILTR